MYIPTKQNIYKRSPQSSTEPVISPPNRPHQPHHPHPIIPEMLARSLTNSKTKRRTSSPHNSSLDPGAAEEGVAVRHAADGAGVRLVGLAAEVVVAADGVARVGRVQGLGDVGEGVALLLMEVDG